MQRVQFPWLLCQQDAVTIPGNRLGETLIREARQHMLSLLLTVIMRALGIKAPWCSFSPQSIVSMLAHAVYEANLFLQRMPLFGKHKTFFQALLVQGYQETNMEGGFGCLKQSKATMARADEDIYGEQPSESNHKKL